MALVGGGCGGGGDERAKTRPAQLFQTPPAGLEYTLPDRATLAQVTKLVGRQNGFHGDDFALRRVVRKGSRRAVGFVAAVDAHSIEASGGVARGFAHEAEDRTGQKPRTVTVAGTDMTLIDYQGVKIGEAKANGYVLAGVALDEAGVRVLLARLIFAARGAER